MYVHKFVEEKISKLFDINIAKTNFTIVKKCEVIHVLVEGRII